MSTIADNIALVSSRIRAAALAAHRDEHSVQLLAVSKTKPAEAKPTESSAEPPLIPIRVLMGALPYHLHTRSAPGWTALATGFDSKAQNALNRLLRTMPDKPVKPPAPAPLSRRWLHGARPILRFRAVNSHKQNGATQPPSASASAENAIHEPFH